MSKAKARPPARPRAPVEAPGANPRSHKLDSRAQVTLGTLDKRAPMETLADLLGDADLSPIMTEHMDIPSLVALRGTSRLGRSVADADPDLAEAECLRRRCEGRMSETDDKIVLERMCELAFKGRLRLLKYARALPHPDKWAVAAAAEAARNGHMHVLEWMHLEADPPFAFGRSYIPTLDESLDELQLCAGAECAGAASGGQLETLKWMRARTPPYPWNGKVYGAAASFGHVHVLDWAWEHGCPENKGDYPNRHDSWVQDWQATMYRSLRHTHLELGHVRDDDYDKAMPLITAKIAAEVAMHKRVVEWMRPRFSADVMRAVDRTFADATKPVPMRKRE